MTNSTVPKSGTVDLRTGAQLYYEEQGSGPVLLLVHGMWASCRFFHKQFAGLSSGYRVIAPDLRGHGRSSMTPAGLTMPSLAIDLKAFIDHLGITSFVGVGWSMGAFILWEYFRLFGDQGFRGHVVVDQPPSDLKSSLIPDALLSVETFSGWQQRLMTDRNVFMAEVVPMMFAKPPAPEDARWMHDEMTRAPESIAAAIFTDSTFRDYSELMLGFPVPTLVCGGANSAQPKKGMELIVERVKDGVLEMFDGCAHCLFLEAPETFNRAVERFERRLAPR